MKLDKRPMTEQERVDAINKLIPAAQKEARAKVRKLGRRYERQKGAGNHLFRFDFHSMYFHRAMNRMAKEAGLR